MKRVIITISILITIIVLTSFVNKTINIKENEKNYAQTFVVTEVTEEEIICVDFNGNEWSFNNDTKDWFVGDLVSAIMSNNGTEIIYDDYFVSIRYSGWIDKAWN